MHSSDFFNFENDVVKFAFKLNNKNCFEKINTSIAMSQGVNGKIHLLVPVSPHAPTRVRLGD